MRIVTSTGAAKILGVSPQTILDWVSKGQIKAIKTPGGQVRLDIDEVLEDMRKNGVTELVDKLKKEGIPVPENLAKDVEYRIPPTQSLSTRVQLEILERTELLEKRHSLLQQSELFELMALEYLLKDLASHIKKYGDLFLRNDRDEIIKDHTGSPMMRQIPKSIKDGLLLSQTLREENTKLLEKLKDTKINVTNAPLSERFEKVKKLKKEINIEALFAPGEDVVDEMEVKGPVDDDFEIPKPHDTQK
jgi:excisionase family DNA binding protein